MLSEIRRDLEPRAEVTQHELRESSRVAGTRPEIGDAAQRFFHLSDDLVVADGRRLQCARDAVVMASCALLTERAAAPLALRRRRRVDKRLPLFQIQSKGTRLGCQHGSLGKPTPDHHTMVVEGGGLIGAAVSHNDVLELPGSGSMGVVYKARDTRLGPLVALKFLPPELTRHPVAKQRLVQEARTASLFDHPSVCTIHEIEETPDGRAFICMALCEGDSLSAQLARGALSVSKALVIAIQIADGLVPAHQHGVVHRDIEPDNSMIAGDDDSYVSWGNLPTAHDALPGKVERAHAAHACAATLAEEQRRVNASDPQLLIDLAGYCGTLVEQQNALTLLDTVVETNSVEPNLAACSGESFEDLGERARVIEWLGKAPARDTRWRRSSAPPNSRTCVATNGINAWR